MLAEILDAWFAGTPADESGDRANIAHVDAIEQSLRRVDRGVAARRLRVGEGGRLRAVYREAGFEPTGERGTSASDPDRMGRFLAPAVTPNHRGRRHV